MTIPKVAVLLATFNGRKYIAEQFSSIISQLDVSVRVFLRDDGSTDGTLDWAESVKDERLTILRGGERGLGPGQNFLSALCEVPLDDFDYIAFSDQDDIWLPSKLSAAVCALRNNYADGYSSDLLAYDESLNRAWFLRKHVVEKPFDHLFQTASAGCTYVFKRELALAVKASIGHTLGRMPSKVAHDWVVYALCRATDGRWIHVSDALILYRQHGGNFHGAGGILSDAVKKVSMLNAGWYRSNIIWLLGIIGKNGIEDEILFRMRRLSFFDRVWFILNARKFRRRTADVISLAILFALKRI